MQLLLILALPCLGAALAPAADRAGRPATITVALLPPAAALILLCGGAPAALAGSTLVVSWPWLPDFGLYLAFRLDGLSFLFAALVLAIGLLVLVYSAAYLGRDEPIGRFLRGFDDGWDAAREEVRKLVSDEGGEPQVEHSVTLSGVKSANFTVDSAQRSSAHNRR
jgi:hypothetical protein